jgi:hypothetical protein
MRRVLRLLACKERFSATLLIPQITPETAVINTTPIVIKSMNFSRLNGAQLRNKPHKGS